MLTTRKATAAGWQEVANLSPGARARSILITMLISLMTYRRFDQRAVVVVNYWTVDGGTVTLLRRQWDPQGPMSARDAALAAMEEAIAGLRPPAREEQPQPGGQSWTDEPLPGL